MDVIEQDRLRHLEEDINDLRKRRPVYCAHPDLLQISHGDYTDCRLCKMGWLTSDGPRPIVIGYVGGEGGK